MITHVLAGRQNTYNYSGIKKSSGHISWAAANILSIILFVEFLGNFLCFFNKGMHTLKHMLINVLIGRRKILKKRLGFDDCGDIEIEILNAHKKVYSAEEYRHIALKYV